MFTHTHIYIHTGNDIYDNESSGVVIRSLYIYIYIIYIHTHTHTHTYYIIYMHIYVYMHVYISYLSIYNII
jgi:hypothetical protein